MFAYTWDAILRGTKLGCSVHECGSENISSADLASA